MDLRVLEAEYTEKWTMLRKNQGGSSAILGEGDKTVLLILQETHGTP